MDQNNKVFNAKHHHKLDNPERRKEMPALEILEEIGLKRGDTFVDVGCGVGYFTLPAAGITKSKVYGLDISKEMLDIVKTKMQHEEIELILTKNANFSISDGVADIVFLCNVFHELDDVPGYVSEFHRILKPNGSLVIIDWKKEEMDRGPKLSHRVSQEEVIEYTSLHFSLDSSKSLGEMLYVVKLSKK